MSVFSSGMEGGRRREERGREGMMDKLEKERMKEGEKRKVNEPQDNPTLNCIHLAGGFIRSMTPGEELPVFLLEASILRKASC